MSQTFLLGGALGIATVAACGGGIDLRLGGATDPADSSIDAGGTGGAGGTLDASGGSSGGSGRDSGRDSSSACPDPDRVIEPERLDLLNELRGFGELTTGGLAGCLYHVTNGSDDGTVEGSLRHAVERPEPLWIVFDDDFEITLTKPLVMLGNKTVDGRILDGRPRKVTLYGYPVQITKQANIILENLYFQGLPGDLPGIDSEDEDGMTLSGQETQKIWIDHCSFTGYHDGLIDIKQGATAITISASYFFDHDKVMNFGVNVADVLSEGTRVTLHHNYFRNTRVYHPRLRYGYVHMFNNYLHQFVDWGPGSSMGAKLFSERNLYVAKDTEREVFRTDFTPDDPSQGSVRSDGDVTILEKDAAAEGFKRDQTIPEPGYTYEPDPTEALVGIVPFNAGPRR